MIKIAKVLAITLSLTLCVLSVRYAQQRDSDAMDVDVSNLKQTVQYLTALQPPRSHDNLASLRAAASYVEAQFESFGLNTQRQTFPVGDREYANVIGVLNEHKETRIVIGAHYDVFGHLPGADDNASGVAVLLETARLAIRHMASSPFRFDFVAFALEEPPFFGGDFMGSHVHAKSLYEGLVDVRAMICLEMVGYFTEEEKSQKYPLGLMKFFYPPQGNFIAVVGNFGSGSLVRQVKKGMVRAAIPVRTLSAPSWVLGVDLSDHRNYWKFGYKAVMITDTSFYRNPHYHQPSDTIHTLDFDKMDKVTQGLLQALATFN